jgi:hypothetical protein
MNSQLHTCQNFTELKRLQGRQGFVDQKTWSSFSSTLANEPNPSNLKYFPPVVNMSMVCWSAFWSSHLHQSHQTGFPSEDVPSPCDIHHSEPSGVLQNLQMSMFRTSAYGTKDNKCQMVFPEFEPEIEKLVAGCNSSCSSANIPF